MATHKTAGEEPETKNLSCHSKPTVESGEKPDETDATQLLKPTAIGQTSDPRKQR